jgi:hypothetical protein
MPATKESVLKRINDLIANPVEADAGDEWPTLTREQVSAFHEIVYDLANLAFQPDYKDRNVLDIHVVDQKRFTLHSFYTEKDVDLYSDDLSESAFYRAFASQTRAGSAMIGTGQRIVERMIDIAHERARRMEETEEKEGDIAGLKLLLDMGKLDEFRVRSNELIEKYDPPRYAGTGEAAKTPYNRSGAYRNIPEELQLLIDDYGVALPEEDAEAALAEITPLLDVAEGRVGIDHRVNGYEGSFDEAVGAAREALTKHKYRVGRRVLQPATARFNRMSEEHRVIQRLAARGLKVVDA